MKKRLVLIILSVLLVISIGFNIYFLVKNNHSKVRELICEKSEKTDEFESTIRYTNDVDFTGKITKTHIRMFTTYKNKDDYEVNKKAVANEPEVTPTYKDKKMQIIKDINPPTLLDEKGNVLEEWYYENMKSFTADGFKCTFK